MLHRSRREIPSESAEERHPQTRSVDRKPPTDWAAQEVTPAKLSLPAIRKNTPRMVSKREYVVVLLAL